MRSTLLVSVLATAALCNAWPAQLRFGGDAASSPNNDDTSADAISAKLPSWRVGRPGAPPAVIDLSDYTIAEILNGSLHEPFHQPGGGPPKWPPLKKFAFLVNASNSSPFKDAIMDDKASITLLAPDNFALTPPHHGGPPHHDHDHDHDHEHEHHEHGHEHDDHPMEKRESNVQSPRRHPFHAPHMLSSLMVTDDDDDHRKEMKEKFLRILTFILQYHLVDSGAYTGLDLVNNSTIASSLPDIRLRVQPELFPYPSLVFNVFSRTRGPMIKAKNGIIHLISAPLLPPLAPLEELFLFPVVFSTLTSGLQKVDLDAVLSPFIHNQAEQDAVSPVVSSVLEELVKEHMELQEFTVFAPTNFAFAKLGFKLNAFLFSPFGRRALKAILSYHIVPNVTVFSDFVSHPSKVSLLSEETVNELPLEGASDSMDELVSAGLLPMPRPHHLALPAPGEIKVKHYSLKTLLNETVLPMDVYEARRGPFGKGPVRRSIWVGDGSSKLPGARVQVAFEDGPALKGAFHVIRTLIRPPFAQHGPPHHHDHEHEHGAASTEDADAHHFWRFARSLSGKGGKRGCPGKRADVWDQLLA